MVCFWHLQNFFKGVKVKVVANGSRSRPLNMPQFQCRAAWQEVCMHFKFSLILVEGYALILSFFNYRVCYAVGFIYLDYNARVKHGECQFLHLVDIQILQ